ncbi:hypothetical protein CAPTEDRAFT_201876 [Capitella teleta]|uniref:Uncharacterized protein n=1 Tax=Capitella teleta TaxID=283909 RepID=R7VEC9_CAPTE|nr:hypothetical protein CAPTEDRAFT_201876 [Capitella teleta]|eukprot:ELU16994.1 hypothetical protein CAPTEDRAFT_201876 [Capitella teleta]
MRMRSRKIDDERDDNVLALLYTVYSCVQFGNSAHVRIGQKPFITDPAKTAAAKNKDINPKFRHTTPGSDIDTLNTTAPTTTAAQENSTWPIIALNETSMDNFTDFSVANVSAMANSSATANTTAKSGPNVTSTQSSVTSAPNVTSATCANVTFAHNVTSTPLNVTEDLSLFDLNANVSTEAMVADIWTTSEVTSGPNSTDLLTSDGFNTTEVDEDYDEYDDDYEYEYYDVDDDDDSTSQWYYDVDGHYSDEYEKAVANGIAKSHHEDDDEENDLNTAGFGSVPNDQQWLQHMSSKLNERPVDVGLLKNRPLDGNQDVHIGAMKTYSLSSCLACQMHRKLTHLLASQDLKV